MEEFHPFTARRFPQTCRRALIPPPAKGEGNNSKIEIMNLFLKLRDGITDIPPRAIEFKQGIYTLESKNERHN